MDDSPHFSKDDGPKEVFRSQQSLGLITQRFMSLRQKNELMNLNDVAKELNISKRRVYDVINVLEGLGYVVKAEKNNIRWIGDQRQDENQDMLEASVERLRQQERILEMMLKDAHCQLKMHFEDPISRPYCYVPKNDLRTTCAPESKSIIVKSDMDNNSRFEIQVTEPSTSDPSFDMIVRNKGGVKSHALLFTHEGFVTEEKTEVKKEMVEEVEEKKPEDVTLASIRSLQVKREDVDDDDSDMDDLETFVIPTSIDSSTSYVPETPGRGLFLSPFRNLIDPTCVLPSFNDDFIPITSPQNDDRDPGSILDVFDD